jgi:hypothetical protein
MGPVIDELAALAEWLGEVLPPVIAGHLGERFGRDGGEALALGQAPEAGATWRPA